jgi:hypothetical protein
MDIGRIIPLEPSISSRDNARTFRWKCQIEISLSLALHRDLRAGWNFLLKIPTSWELRLLILI